MSCTLLINSEQKDLVKNHLGVITIPYKFVQLSVGDYLIIIKNHENNTIYVLDFIVQVIRYDKFEELCHNHLYDTGKLLLLHSFISNIQYIFVVDQYKKSNENIEKATISLNTLGLMLKLH